MTKQTYYDIIINVNKNNLIYESEVMTMAKKMTKRDYFEMLLDVEGVKDNEELVEFINYQLVLLERKNKGAKNSKPSARQVENKNVLKPQIIEFLDGKDGATATEIAEGVALNVSVPRVSAMLKQLVTSDIVTRTEIKGKPYFSLA